MSNISGLRIMHTAVILTTCLFILYFSGMSPAHAQPPYTGQQLRDIKALSSNELDDYLNGRGMGLAKAAELNSYPGPRHVLDLSTELALQPSQIAKTTKIFETMQENARSLGRQLVDKERELDRLFASKRIDDIKLKQLLSDIATLTGQLRYTHLQAHLQQTALLNEEQIQRYNALRGYGDAPHDKHQQHHHGH